VSIKIIILFSLWMKKWVSRVHWITQKRRTANENFCTIFGFVLW
jgi:hypothetical protein